ncbi:MAG TPA: DegT/DnrJ/EryC1/StrS family aminotransferase [Mycobacterium sp.]|nr:DegT/DnrJ/EryC1/StrS family aminotransferase [Mycobacterium sp.]
MVIPLFHVALAEEEILAGVAEVLRSRQLEHGSRVERFEQAVGERLGNPRVVAVSSGTSGLQLALDVALRRGCHAGALPGRGEPGEVLSTPLTFEGTNWPVLALGLSLSWVDVDPSTLNMDLDDLAQKIRPSTRAIMVVHWTGYPVDLDRLRQVLDQAEAAHGVRPVVIEDAAQAWGATYRSRPLGNHGNPCVFSCQSLKLLSCGGGGLVVFPDDEQRERAMRRRWLGIDRAAADRIAGRYDVPEWGYRFTMPEINATIGAANLGIVDDLLASNRANAAYFDAHLAGVPGLRLTERAADREPSFWLYPVRVDDRSGFMRRMADAGIATSVMIRRNDAHSCVRQYRARLPGMDEVADQMVNIPVGWWLSEEDRKHIVRTIQAGW